MSKNTDETDELLIRATKVSIRVKRLEKGDIDISVHHIPQRQLKAIAEATGKKIKKYTRTTWIDFSRARDKSQLCLFGE